MQTMMGLAALTRLELSRRNPDVSTTPGYKELACLRSASL